MPSVGETLRQARLRRGLTLEEIAERSRISARFLEALEAEDWDQLPGRFFARSFLRQYASFLGVDANLSVPEIEEQPEPEPVEPAPAPHPLRIAPIVLDSGARRLFWRRWLGSLAALVAVILACALVYAVWQRLRAAPAARPETAANAAPASILPDQPAAPAPPQPAAPIVVAIRTTSETWYRVTCDGTLVHERAVPPGGSLTFQARESLRVLTGNAGGMEVVFNGKPLGAPGPRGHIRVLEFTPSAHQILERKPPPEPAPAPDAAAPGGAGA
ncbi:MAG: helix-turn-helix domain-containing protein [Acidobacteria bacterium]|nr:helix-turn-helix domain-containing protein [Acidobacteriota bacterium]